MSYQFFDGTPVTAQTRPVTHEDRLALLEQRVADLETVVIGLMRGKTLRNGVAIDKDE